MEITAHFAGNMRVNAAIDDHLIETDQSVANGGEGAAPEPFDLFLASIVTCAGSYALSFMKARGIDAAGSRLTMTVERDERTRLLTDVQLTLHLPPGFPDKYRAPVRRSMEKCSVKRCLLEPPVISVTTADAAGPPPAP
jgi:ribosomal protein S12 methylthiotransferase accessory factor